MKWKRILTRCNIFLSSSFVVVYYTERLFGHTYALQSKYLITASHLQVLICILFPMGCLAHFHTSKIVHAPNLVYKPPFCAQIRAFQMINFVTSTITANKITTSFATLTFILHQSRRIEWLSSKTKQHTITKEFSCFNRQLQCIYVPLGEHHPSNNSLTYYARLIFLG